MNKKFLIISTGLLAIALLFVFVFVLINIPRQSIESTPTSNVPLPDLTITSVYVSMADNNGNCLPYFGVFVTVVNQGNAPATDVFLAEMSSAQEVGIGTLDVFQSITMPFVAQSPNGVYTVVVDPHNRIAESDETNNSVPYSGVTATPPISCLPGQFDNNTPTPASLGQFSITTALPQQYFIPMFTAPADWSQYTNSEPAYEIYYPSDAIINVHDLDPQTQSKLLTITIPVQIGTQVLDKNISVRTRSSVDGSCYANGNGVMQISGLDFAYREGVFWHTISNGVGNQMDVFQSEYTTINPHNGFCYYILLEVTKQHSSDFVNETPLPTPSRSDVDIEILLSILSTLKIY